MSEGVSIIVDQNHWELNNWRKKYHAKWFVNLFYQEKCWMRMWVQLSARGTTNVLSLIGVIRNLLIFKIKNKIKIISGI
jgi:hypothetical protein